MKTISLGKYLKIQCCLRLFSFSAVVGILFATLLFSCTSSELDKSSSGASNGVLSEVSEGESVPEIPETASNSVFDELNAALEKLGYRGVGLKFEKDATLRLLIEVFKDKRSHDRSIQLVYTGLRMSYDAEQESLTVGGLTNVGAILEYIQTNVPLRAAPLEPTPLPADESESSETPVSSENPESPESP